MKNFELWMDASGRIGEFLDAQPDAVKIGARAWRSGGGVIRVFPIRRMGMGKNGPPGALVIRYPDAGAHGGRPSLADRLLKLLGRRK